MILRYSIILGFSLLLSFPMFAQTVKAGQKAPEIVSEQPNGKTLKLSSLEGQNVLLVFWSSKCGRCKVYKPQLMEFYNKHKDLDNPNAEKSFTVMGVSVDSDKDSWMDAIKHNNYAYPHHVSDLKSWFSQAAQDYGIRSIPQTILIDNKGMIVATNPSFEVVEEYINTNIKN